MALSENFTTAFPNLTPDQINQLVQTVRQGFSTAQAAQQLGITLPAPPAAPVVTEEEQVPLRQETQDERTATARTARESAPPLPPLPPLAGLTPAPAAPPSVPQQPTFQQPLTPGPGTGFQVDPRDSEKVLASLAQFVNAMFGSQQPGLISGQFTNPNQVSGGLQNQFTNTIQGPEQFQNFMNQLSGFGTGSPLGDVLSQSLQGQIGGGGGDQLQDLIATLFGQPAIQSLSTSRASQGLQQLRTEQNQGGGGPDFLNASGDPANLTGVQQTLLGQPAGQSTSTGRASNLFQGLTQGGGTGSDLQGFLDQQLRGCMEGGGIADQTVQAQRARILVPAQEALRGRLNQQGGGVADLNSPLFQELQRRQESDFLNDQLIQAGQNLQGQFGQAGQLGQQQFGNLFGVGQAQGQLGQTQQQINQGAIGLGAGLQNQGFEQILQTLLAQGNLGQQQQQINQQAIGVGGQLQNQLATQGLQGTQLGLGREEFQGQFQQNNVNQALQFLQLMNLFGLGQTDIASANTRQILGGAQIAAPKGSFLNALVGGGATVAGAFAGRPPG